MSREHLLRVWDVSQAKGAYLLVLLALSDLADAEGNVTASVASIAKKARLTRRRSVDILNELVQGGEIERVSPGGGSDAAVYQLREWDAESPTRTYGKPRPSRRPPLDPAVARLVETCQQIPGWIKRLDDDRLIRVALKKLSVPQLDRLIHRLELHQAATGDYTDLRRALGGWIKREVPEARMPYEDLPPKDMSTEGCVPPPPEVKAIFQAMMGRTI